MARDISDTFKSSMMGETTEEVIIDLFEITDPALSAPIRLANAREDVTHNGDVYKAVAMQLTRPIETVDDVPGEISLAIDDTDQSLLVELEKIPPVQDVLPEVVYRMILASDPDTAEIEEYYDLTVDDLSLGRILLTLQQDNFLLEPFPGDLISPPTHPAAFGGDD